MSPGDERSVWERAPHTHLPDGMLHKPGDKELHTLRGRAMSRREFAGSSRQLHGTNWGLGETTSDVEVHLTFFPYVQNLADGRLLSLGAPTLTKRPASAVDGPR
jgi:hypothetical protein